MPRARARAVEFYDDNQRQKITSYNIRLVVSAARRHIRQHLSDLWERRPVFLRVALSLETERTRRSSWNAARRIVRWVTTGSRREMIIHKDDLLGPDDIKPLVLASDCIEQERRGLEELSRMLLDRLLCHRILGIGFSCVTAVLFPLGRSEVHPPPLLRALDQAPRST
ncbi:hypothetical protein NCS56_00380900 [Fusarium sp. Ph1]|nr:hypothetical protein NCS56_00380900 [Fusarium sp. Ph1]